MKKALCILAALAFGGALGCKAQATGSLGSAAEPARTTLAIKGMTCGGCVAAVKVQLRKTEGVSAYDVSLEKAEAQVTYDPAKTDPKRIADSVSKTGFPASVKQPADPKKPN
jgi:copper chaperone